MVSYNYQPEYWEDQPAPVLVVTENRDDMGGYHLTVADHIICLVYSEHLHRNNGSHLNRGVAKNAVWQHQWWRIVNIPMRWCDALLACMGKCLDKRLTAELKEVYSTE